MHTYRHYLLTTLTASPSPTIVCPFFQGTMSHNEDSSPTESRVVLRTQGMNEVLPRHDLDMFTSAGTYPHGSWELSEVGQPHQFQAAYCVRDAQGQKVRAPMPLVSLSAVTNQEEIYQHCTVYHYDPSESCDRRNDFSKADLEQHARADVTQITIRQLSPLASTNIISTMLCYRSKAIINRRHWMSR